MKSLICRPIRSLQGGQIRVVFLPTCAASIIFTALKFQNPTNRLVVFPEKNSYDAWMSRIFHKAFSHKFWRRHMFWPRVLWEQPSEPLLLPLSQKGTVTWVNWARISHCYTGVENHDHIKPKKSKNVRVCWFLVEDSILQR